ncbi:hypothetical protein [Streptomyces venezuelae]|uniref:hypothetical protein n=1 Tax=Streptomyces venezuelae TaxID=54571 RepID=UPI001F404D49|nr:hypothetical protein [Streptomyces venezuelae]
MPVPVSMLVLADLREAHPVEVRADRAQQALIAARTASRQPQVDRLPGLGEGPYGPGRPPVQRRRDHQLRGGARESAFQSVRALIAGTGLPHRLRGTQASRRDQDLGPHHGRAVLAEHSALDGHGTGGGCTGHGLT